MELLQESFFSWNAVYIALTFPAFVMALNFIIGNCLLNEFMAHTQLNNNPKKYYQIIGRMIIIFIMGLFIWQYYTYMIQTRMECIQCCNLPVYMWYSFDWIFWGKRNISWNLLFNCSINEVCYLLLFITHIILFFICVLSKPQVKEGSPRCSFCSKCRAYVECMDHHCLIINNCVGLRNRKFFLCLLGVCFLNMLYLLLMKGSWAYQEGGIIILIGLILVIFIAVLSSCLLLVQCFLIRKGKTTLSILKERRQSPLGIFGALFFD